jgi:hypothetical protein
LTPFRPLWELKLIPTSVWSPLAHKLQRALFGARDPLREGSKGAVNFSVRNPQKLIFRFTNIKAVLAAIINIGLRSRFNVKQGIQVW